MRSNRTSPPVALLLAALALVLAGCGGQVSYEKEYFVLDAERPIEADDRPAETASIEVSRFTVDAAFATRNFIYRTSEFEYEADYYRQFLIDPGRMVTERTRDWLADSGVFQRVLPVGSRASAEYTLEGTVTALYGDFRDETPEAVMEIRFFLLTRANGTETFVFDDTYRATVPIPAQAASSFVEALNTALVEILGRLEADLRGRAGGRTEGPTPVPSS